MVNRGIPELYDKICKDITKEPFIEWIRNSQTDPAIGQFCWTVAWYVKRKKWYLEEAVYDKYHEENSTWYAREFSGNFPPPNSQNVMRHYELEKNERLITTNSKIRPVILLRETIDDWWNPGTAARHVHTYLCLPLFRYKPTRHNQEYVLKDQMLQNPDNFYIPRFYGSTPGVLEESCARFQAIQMVAVEHLDPMKHRCSDGDVKMQRPFKLTRSGLRIVMYHFWKSLGIYESLEEMETDYELFRSETQELIEKARSASS